MTYTKLSNKIKKQILSHQVISFDIFDTLLVRPYIKPADMFVHMQHALSVPGFAKHRMLAEELARKHTNNADITIDDIYKQIPAEFRKLKTKELQWEQTILQPNQWMLEIYKFAKQQKKQIIIASDMYLSPAFLEHILKKNGFTDYNKLYISGYTNVSKHNGSMFDLILNDFNVAPKNVLHIGDNKYSDYKVPKNKKIHAILIPNLIHDYIKTDTRNQKFIDLQHGSIGASILISSMALYSLSSQNNNYWYNLGYEYAGPIIYGYIHWIIKIAQAKKIKHLLFVARDGYTLQKVFNVFNTNIKSDYIYAPRFLNLVCRLDYTFGNSVIAKAQQKTIIEYYKANELIKSQYQHYDFCNNSMENFLIKNKSTLQKLAHKNLDHYKKYIRLYAQTKNIGLVDTITINWSAQNLVTAVLKRGTTITGFYWYTRNNSVNNKYFSFFETSNTNKAKYIKQWGLMEFLMTSPEFPVEGISENFKPIYKKNNCEAEQHIRKIYPNISMGALDFAKHIKNIFNDMDIDFNYDILVDYINCFCAYPTKQDYIHFGTIQTSSNPNNDYYESLFRKQFKKFYVIKHPIRWYKQIKGFMWPSISERVIINITHPIKLHIHGLKKIIINILPKMRHKVCDMNIMLFKKINFRVCIGDENEI